MNYFKADKHNVRRCLRRWTSIPNEEIRRMSYKKLNSVYMNINPNTSEFLRQDSDSSLKKSTE